MFLIPQLKDRKEKRKFWDERETIQITFTLRTRALYGQEQIQTKLITQ